MRKKKEVEGIAEKVENKKPKKNFKPKNMGTKAKVLAAKALNPEATASDIARQFDLNPSTVSVHLNGDQGKVLRDAVQKEEVDTIVRIRKKALKKLEKFIDKKKLKDETQLAALRFVLAPIMGKEEVDSPDTLVFETTISEGGAVEQQEHKVFNRVTLSRGKGSTQSQFSSDDGEE